MSGGPDDFAGRRPMDKRSKAVRSWCGRGRVVGHQAPAAKRSKSEATMGSTFVGIDDNGFWMRDGLLELWLRLLALHIEDAKDRLAPAHRLRDEWLLASRGYFHGCVPLDLEANTASAEGRRVVLGAIHSLMEALQHAPDALDAGVLNLMGMEGAFTLGIQRKQLLEIGQAFLDLLDGRHFGGPSETSFMPGSSV